MGLEKAYRMDINKYAETKAISRNKRLKSSVFGKNQLLWDLGMNTDLMPNRPAVIKMIEHLNKQFDFVLIAEYFDESLLLLNKHLCWPLKDMTYLKQNERTPGKYPEVFYLYCALYISTTGYPDSDCEKYTVPGVSGLGQKYAFTKKSIILTGSLRNFVKMRSS